MTPLLSSLRNLKKRKKEKQDPPGGSSQPASHSPAGAPTPNIIPSAADSSSSKADLAIATPDNVSSQHGNISSDRSGAKATVLNMFKLTLVTLSTASDNVPVPGLKLAMEGLLSVIIKVQVRL
jgi:hypothetical protein